MEKTNLDQPNDSDASLVRVAMNVKTLARLRTRFKGVQAKGTDEFLKQQQHRLKLITEAIDEPVDKLICLKLTTAWDTVTNVGIPFIIAVLLCSKHDKGAQAKVKDKFRTRSMLQALASPSESGFVPILDCDALKKADEQFKNLKGVVAAITQIVDETELEDHTTSVAQTIFDKPWRRLWDTCVGSDYWNEGTVRASVPEASVEDVLEALQKLLLVFNDKAKAYLEPIKEKNPWFAAVKLPKKQIWPNGFSPDKLLATDNDGESIAYCCSIRAVPAQKVEANETSMELRELEFLFPAMEVGRSHIQLARATSKPPKELVDPKQVGRFEDLLVCHGAAIDGYYDRSSQCPSRVFKDALATFEVPFLQNAVEILYGAVLNTTSGLATAAVALAKDPNVVLVDDIHPEFNATNILEKV